MELADLLETHSVMFQVNNLEDSSPSIALCECANADELITTGGNYHNFISVFKIQSPLQGLPGYRNLVRLQFVYNANISYRGESNTTYTVTLVVAASQPNNDEVVVRMRNGIVTGSGYLESASITLDVGTTYALIAQYKWTSGTGAYIFAWLVTLDTETGVPVYITNGYLNGTLVTGDAVNNKFINFRLVTGTLNSLKMSAWQMYEPMYHGKSSVQDDVLYNSPRLWKGARVLDFTYYTNSYVEKFLLPPKHIMDAAAYNRTELLDDLLADADAKIDILQTDLDDALADIEDLISALSLASATLDALDDRVTPARAGYLDYINNQYIAMIPDLSNLTSLRQQYLDNINNPILAQLPESLVDFTSDIISYLDNPNLAYLPNIGLLTPEAIADLIAFIAGLDYAAINTMFGKLTKGGLAEFINYLVDEAALFTLEEGT